MWDKIWLAMTIYNASNIAPSDSHFLMQFNHRGSNISTLLLRKLSKKKVSKITSLKLFNMYKNNRRIRAKNVNRFFFLFMSLNIKVYTITDYGEQIIINAQYIFKKWIHDILKLERGRYISIWKDGNTKALW